MDGDDEERRYFAYMALFVFSMLLLVQAGNGLILLAGWGLVTFRRARTTTVPGQISAELVTWGPYSFTRNPMYVGLTIAYIGETFILQQIWPRILLLLVLAYVNWVVIPLEQRKLSETFGEEYARYQVRVRRWL
jgi:protein-S-isoprenylcysteine O-methyltransferase Ste14